MLVAEKSRHISVQEMADDMGVHSATIRNWLRKKILPGTQIPGTRGWKTLREDYEVFKRKVKQGEYN